MTNNKQELPEGFHDLGEYLSMKGQDHIAKLEEEADTHIHYPSLWFHNKSELKDLPKEGVAEVMYRKVMEREEKVMVNGKEESRYTTELEICGIRSNGSSEKNMSEDNEPSDDDAIEKGLEAASESTTD